MNATNRNRLLALGALLIAGGALAFISFSNLADATVYYWTPSQMLAEGEKAFGPTIRLGGIVQPGSVVWNSAHTQVEFKVADDHKPGSIAVPVVCTQTPPQMFREGIGVVLEGRFDRSKVFKTDRLMVKHSNEYRAPHEGEKPSNWNETVNASAEGT